VVAVISSAVIVDSVVFNMVFLLVFVLFTTLILGGENYSPFFLGNFLNIFFGGSFLWANE
jgi:hypothetical protein